MSKRPTIHEKVWYRLSNSEEGKALDVVNTSDDKTGKVELRPIGNYSGQYWRILNIGEGHYSMQTQYLGPDKMLDVYGNDPRTPHLADKGDYSGQKWYFTWWPGTDTYKVSNTYGGLYLALDTKQGKEVVMAPQDPNSATQKWRVTELGPVESD